MDDSAEQQIKSMDDRAKEVGRDGAYLEVDASELVEALDEGALAKAVVVVITAARIDLNSDLKKAFMDKLSAAIKANDGDSRLTNEQLSFSVLLSVFEKGLLTAN